MHALGFDICDRATNGQQAFLRAVGDQPDVVLMDVNLEGGREGIEAARWLREVCDVPIIFVIGYTDHDTSSASTNRYREHRCCPSSFIIPASPTPWRRSARAITESSSEPLRSGSEIGSP